MKRALVLGITGQDGSWLADLLLAKGYQVHGLVRHSSHGPANLWRIQHCLDRLTLHSGDLLDPISIRRVLDDVDPQEVFQMADQDHVGFSLKTPGYSVAVTAGGPMTVLEAVRQYQFSREILPSTVRVYQPCSATMFGCAISPQNEQTPFQPQSPYAICKTTAFYACQHYRREYGMFVSTGILYNHDSERRRGDYLVHKICKAALARASGAPETLRLGTDGLIDLGYAPEYVEGAWKILQQDKPDDFVLSANDPTSILALVQEAYQLTGADWGEVVFGFDDRPGPWSRLLGDSSKARKAFGWAPKVKPEDVVARVLRMYQKEMVTI